MTAGPTSGSHPAGARLGAAPDAAAPDSVFDPREEERDEGSFLSLLRAVAAAPAVPVAAPPHGEELPPGTRLGEHLEIVEKLGAGGMGVVYRARDVQLDRDVAIKVLRFDAWPSPQREQLRDAFGREARATARLQHPNVVTLHQVGATEGAVYLVLELLRGETLARRMARAPLSVDEAIQVCDQVARGLDHAHRAGLVHRDVKPQNVFLTEDGGAKLLDFGLAGFHRVAPAPVADGRALATALADTISSGGTPGYMAPEQWRGAAQDGRTDVFALGVLAFRMLAGAHPYDPREAPPPGPPPSARAHRADLPEALDRVVQRALAIDPADRWPSAGALAEALHGCRTEMENEQKARARRLARERARRHAKIAAVVSAVATLLGGAAWIVVTRMQRAALAARLDGLALDGRWESVPPGITATLVRRGPTSVDFEAGLDPRPGVAPGTLWRHGGELEAARDGDRLLLRGRVADLPGWCCGNVGFVEMELRARDLVWQATSLWGDEHDHYTVEKPPLGYRRAAVP